MSGWPLRAGVAALLLLPAVLALAPSSAVVVEPDAARREAEAAAAGVAARRSVEAMWSWQAAADEQERALRAAWADRMLALAVVIGGASILASLALARSTTGSRAG